MKAPGMIVSAKALVQVFPPESKGAAEIRALGGLDIDIKAGELTALVGPDGAGKTTFLRLIAGLYQPASGQLEVLGFDVSKQPQRVQERIGYMPQRFGLYEDFSAKSSANLDLKIESLRTSVGFPNESSPIKTREAHFLSSDIPIRLTA